MGATVSAQACPARRLAARERTAGPSRRPVRRRRVGRHSRCVSYSTVGWWSRAVGELLPRAGPRGRGRTGRRGRPAVRLRRAGGAPIAPEACRGVRASLFVPEQSKALTPRASPALKIRAGRQETSRARQDCCLGRQDSCLAKRHSCVAALKTRAGKHQTSLGRQDSCLARQHSCVAALRIRAGRQGTSLARQDCCLGRQDSSLARQHSCLAALKLRAGR